MGWRRGSTIQGREPVFHTHRSHVFVKQALADESEYVRDTGLKAGQKIINMFAETSIELLLPEVSYSVLFVTEYYLFIERNFLKSVRIRKQFVIGNLSTWISQ